MGGLGGHHVHSYAVQTAAFLASLLLPGMVLFLVAGAYVERFRRGLGTARRSGKQVAVPVALATEFSAE